MQTFKDYILEKLKISQARKYMKISGGRYKELLDNVFKGEDRIYFPINITFEDIKTTPLIRKIRDHIEKKGYPIEKFSYLGGYVESKKNRLKISKLIRDDESLAKAYSEDPIRAEDKIALFEKELLVVISRHPYDIAGMSTDRHWTSCMNLNPNEKTGQKGAMRHHIAADIEQGSIIAYLIKATDKNIKNPYSRILIKPFIKDISGDNKDIAYVAENSYGVQNDAFQEIVDKWVEENLNSEKQGLYRIQPNLYQDTTPSYKMFGKFNVDEFLSQYPTQNGVTIIPHSINWENNPLDLTELPFKGRQVIVRGDFIISHGHFKSLEGGPIEVGGNFACNDNLIRTLKGCPNRIGGRFYCSGNPLYNLVGGPISVGAGYICSRCRLISLKGSPQIIKGDFYCGQNDIHDFRGGPRNVLGDYSAGSNPIVSLQGLPIHIGGNLDIAINPGEGHHFTKEEVLRVSNVRGQVWSRREDRKFM